MYVDCPSCSTRLFVDDAMIGRHLACPDCGSFVRWPGPGRDAEVVMTNPILEEPTTPQQLVISLPQPVEYVTEYRTVPNRFQWLTVPMAVALVVASMFLFCSLVVIFTPKMPVMPEVAKGSPPVPYSYPRPIANPIPGDPEPEPLKPPTAREKELVRRMAAAIDDAHKRREAAIKLRDAAAAINRKRAEDHGKAIEAYNSAKEKYDDELPKYQKAANEAAAARRLDFTRKLMTNIDNADNQAGANALRERLDMWLRDIVKEFPGTPSADEAAARLRGRKPRDVATPVVPSAPVEPKVPPMPRFEVERQVLPVDEAKIAAEVRRKMAD